MPNINQIVEQIRHAVFGKDVRENIAEGIEKCYEDATANAQIERIIASADTVIGNVNSAGATALNNVNAAGTTAVGNVNAAKNTAVGNINSAATTAVGQVNSAAETAISTAQEATQTAQAANTAAQQATAAANAASSTAQQATTAANAAATTINRLIEDGIDDINAAGESAGSSARTAAEQAQTANNQAQAARDAAASSNSSAQAAANSASTAATNAAQAAQQAAQQAASQAVMDFEDEFLALADEARQSIPETYTALSDDVNALKALTYSSEHETEAATKRIEDDGGANPIPTLFTGAQISTSRTISGYKLLSNGKCAAASGYNILIYSLAVKDIYVEIPTVSGSYAWQFQDSNQVQDVLPNTNVRGTPHGWGYTGYLVVPDRATYLVVCASSSGTQPKVYKAYKSNPGFSPAKDYYYPALEANGWVDNTTGALNNNTSSAWLRTGYIPIPVNEGEKWDYNDPLAGSYNIQWQYMAYYGEKPSKNTNPPFICNMLDFKNQVPYGAKYMAISGPDHWIKKFGIQNPSKNTVNEIKKNVTAAVESDMEIYGNYYDETKKTSDDWLVKSTGWPTGSAHSGYVITDYIHIPNHYADKMRYVMGLSVRNGVWGAWARQLAFYDVNSKFISMWEMGDDNPDFGSTVAIRAVPSNAEYVRVCFLTSETRHMVTFSTNSVIPSYSPFQPKIHGKEIPNLYDNVQNTDGAVSNMLVTALDYAYDSEIRYGSNHTLFDDVCGGKFEPSAWKPDAYTGTAYQMDCSAFVEACLLGIRFKNSRYIASNTRNIEAPYAYRFDEQVKNDIYYDDGYHPGNFGRIYANQIAEYAYKKGLLYRIKNDFSNIQPGDVIFKNESYGWEGKVINFERIGHVVLVLQKYQMKDGKYWIKIVESSTIEYNYGVNRRILTPSDTSVWEWGARFPLRDCYFNFKQVSGSFTPARVNYSFNSSTTRATALELPITTNIKSPMIYTLMFKYEGGGDNVFFEYWVNNPSSYSSEANSIGSSNKDIYMRPDGFHVVHIELPKNFTITTGNKFRIVIRKSSTADSASGYVTITDAKLFEGYLTGNML